MTGRRKTTTTEVDEVPEKERDPFEFALANLGSSPEDDDIIIQIYRIDPATNAPHYVTATHYVPDEHSLDWVRALCGPGAYDIRFRHRKTQKMIQRRVRIDPMPGTKAEQLPPVFAPNKDESSSSLKDVLGIVTKQNEQLLTGLMARGSGGGDGGTSVMVAFMEQQSSMNQMLLGQLLNRPDTAQSVISVAEKVAGVVTDLKMESEGGWAATLTRLAKEVAPLLKDLAQNPALRPVQPGTPGAPGAPQFPPVAPTLGTQAPELVTPSPMKGFVRTNMGPLNNPAMRESTTSDMTPQPGAEMALRDAMQTIAPHLVDAAAQGRDASEVASELLDQFPPVFHESVASVTAQDLKTTDPRLQQHEQWVHALVEAVHKEVYQTELES